MHRIGFDPPPIKENIRLTGELKNVKNYRKTEDLEKTDIEANMRETVALIERIITEKIPVSDENRTLFGKAGNELAQKAIDEPGAYLGTLQQLKWLSESREKLQLNQLRSIQSGLLKALTKLTENPNRGKEPLSTLNNLLLQELERND